MQYDQNERYPFQDRQSCQEEHQEREERQKMQESYSSSSSSFIPEGIDAAHYRYSAPLPAPLPLRRTDCERCDYAQEEGGEEAHCTCPIEDQLYNMSKRIKQIEESLQSVWKKQESDDGPSYLSINGLQLPVNTKKRKGQIDGGPVERAVRICHELYDKVNVRPTYRILRRFKFGSTTTHRALQRWHEDRIAMQGQLMAPQEQEPSPVNYAIPIETRDYSFAIDE
jgi:hypothetical protein